MYLFSGFSIYFGKDFFWEKDYLEVSEQNILIVYHYVAKYRRPIFSQLRKSRVFRFAVAADIVSNNDIKLVDSDFYENDLFYRAKNNWFLNKFLIQGDISKIIDDYNPSAVVFLADPYFLSTWYLSLLLRLKGRKVIFWTHGFIRGRSLLDRIKLLFYKIPHAIFLYGDMAKVNLIRMGVPENKLFPIYNSLDYSEQSYHRELFNENRKVDVRGKYFKNPILPTLYFVGRLTYIKKIDLLLELVFRLDCDDISVNLLIIGSGEAESSLKEHANNLDLKKSEIKFYGQTYNESELSELIMSCDMCISPGEIGLTAMHSLGYGVPVVTHSNCNTQMPEFEAVIDGYTGKLFIDGDFESMVDSVKSMILNPIPKVKENCISVIENKYTPQAQLKLIESALDNVFKI
jgi:glycosyltransferase involved in cell wall biosynthesis